MNSINEIENLRDNLISSNAKSIFSNAHPKKSIDKIDVLELCKLNPLCQVKPAQILEALLSNTPFKTTYNISYHRDEKNKSKRKLIHLFRKNEDYIQEINHDSFSIGYPLVCMADTKRKRLRYIPVFIWNLKLAYVSGRLDQYSIEKNKFADFIVIDRDIMKIDIDKTPQTKVLKTFLGGQLVYSSTKTN